MNKHSSKQCKTSKQRAFMLIKVLALVCCILGVLGVTAMTVAFPNSPYVSSLTATGSTIDKTAILNLSANGEPRPEHFQDIVGAVNGEERQIMTRDTVKFGGHEWYILDTKDQKYTNGGIMLFSADSFGTRAYNSNQDKSQSYWEGSPIDQYLNDGNIYSTWGEAEKNAMQTTKEYTTDLWKWDGGTDAGRYDVHGVSFITASSHVKHEDNKMVDHSVGDHMILLDYYDINNPKYGMYDGTDQTQTYENKVKKAAGFTDKQVGYAAYMDGSTVEATYLQQLTNAGNGDYIWLRPAGQDDSGNNNDARALYVNHSGYVSNGNVNYTTVGVRPAIFLDPNKLIYATNTIETLVSGYDRDDPGRTDTHMVYKLFLQAPNYENYNSVVNHGVSVVTNGNTITITKPYNEPSGMTHAVVLLADKHGTGEVKHQAVASFNGNTATVTLPSGVNPNDFSMTVLYTGAVEDDNNSVDVYGSYTALPTTPDKGQVQVEYMALKDMAVDPTTKKRTDKFGFTQKTTYATPVTADMTTWGVDGQETWLVVNKDVTIEQRVELKGDVHLILMDDYKLTVKNGINESVEEIGNRCSFTIYGQSKGTGELHIEKSVGVLRQTKAGYFTNTINGGIIRFVGTDSKLNAGYSSEGRDCFDGAEQEFDIIVNGGTITGKSWQKDGLLGGDWITDNDTHQTYRTVVNDGTIYDYGWGTLIGKHVATSYGGIAPNNEYIDVLGGEFYITNGSFVNPLAARNGLDGIYHDDYVKEMHVNIKDVTIHANYTDMLHAALIRGGTVNIENVVLDLGANSGDVYQLIMGLEVNIKNSYLPNCVYSKGSDVYGEQLPTADMPYYPIPSDKFHVENSVYCTMDGEDIKTANKVNHFTGNLNLAGDITIPKGPELVIPSGSTLNPNGHKVNMQGGTIRIQAGGKLEQRGNVNFGYGEIIDENPSASNQTVEFNNDYISVVLDKPAYAIGSTPVVAKISYKAPIENNIPVVIYDKATSSATLDSLGLSVAVTGNDVAGTGTLTVTGEWQGNNINKSVSFVVLPGVESVEYSNPIVAPGTHKVTYETATAENVIPLTGSMSTWGAEGETTWYVAKGNITIDPRVEVFGKVNLILADNAVLNTKLGIHTNVNSDFTIYSQSQAESTMGKLVATPSYTDFGVPTIHDDNKARIGSNGYDLGGNYRITINGGNITVSSYGYAPGIGMGGNINAFVNFSGDTMRNFDMTLNGGVINSVSPGGLVVGVGWCNDNKVFVNTVVNNVTIRAQYFEMYEYRGIFGCSTTYEQNGFHQAVSIYDGDFYIPASVSLVNFCTGQTQFLAHSTANIYGGVAHITTARHSVDYPLISAESVYIDNFVVDNPFNEDLSITAVNGDKAESKLFVKNSYLPNVKIGTRVARSYGGSLGDFTQAEDSALANKVTNTIFKNKAGKNIVKGNYTLTQDITVYKGTNIEVPANAGITTGTHKVYMQGGNILVKVNGKFDNKDNAKFGYGELTFEQNSQDSVTQEPTKVTKPSPINTDAHYTFKESGYKANEVFNNIVEGKYAISYVWTSPDGAKTEVVSEIKNAGAYVVTFDLTDKLNNVWNDNGNASFDINIVVDKAQLARPTAVADHSSAKYVKNGFDESHFITFVDGKNPNYTVKYTHDEVEYNETRFTELGAYNATISINDPANYEWADKKTDDITIDWTIGKGEIAITSKVAGNADLKFKGKGVTQQLVSSLLDTPNTNDSFDAAKLEYTVTDGTQPAEGAIWTQDIKKLVGEYVGDYTIWARATADSEHYTQAQAINVGEVSIAKGDITDLQATITDKNNKVYNGDAERMVSAITSKSVTNLEGVKVVLGYKKGTDEVVWQSEDKIGTFDIFDIADAGAYDVYAKVDNDANVNNLTARSIGTFNIAKYDIDVTVDGVSAPYTGSAVNIYTNVNGNTLPGVNGDIQYAICKVGDSTKEYGDISKWNTPINVGKYELWIKYTDTNHTGNITEKEVKVGYANGVTPEITAVTAKFSTEAQGKGTLAFNGHDQALISEPITQDGSIEYEITFNGKTTTVHSYAEVVGQAVGKYTVVCKIKGDANHTDFSALAIDVTITKGAASVTTRPVANDGLSYNGGAQQLLKGKAETNAVGGTVEYYVSKGRALSEGEIKSLGDDQWKSNTKDIVGEEAATYYVYVRTLGDDSHKDQYEIGLPQANDYTEVTIGKASIDPSLLKVQITQKEFGYTGSPITVVGKPSGLFNGKGISYEIVIEETKDSIHGMTSDGGSGSTLTVTDAGTYTIKYRVQDSTNYKESAWVSETIKVNPKQIVANITVTPDDSLQYKAGVQQSLITAVDYHDLDVMDKYTANWQVTDPVGNVSNSATMGGTGWQDMKGTRAGTYYIEYWISSKAVDSNLADSEHKVIEVKIANANSDVDYPVVVPTPNTELVYDYTNQNLLESLGSIAKDGYSIQYTLGKANGEEGGLPKFDGAPDNNWKDGMPQAMSAGKYRVYYKVMKNGVDEQGFEIDFVEAMIKKAPANYTAPVANNTVEWTDQVIDLDQLITMGKTEPGFGTMEYSWDGVNWYEAGNAKLNIAHDTTKLTLKYRVLATSDYEGVESEINITLIPTSVEIGNRIKISFAEDFDYDGSEHSLVVNVTPIDGIVGDTLVGYTVYRPDGTQSTATGVNAMELPNRADLKGKRAGTYVIKYYLEGTDYYKKSDVVTKTITINQVQGADTPDFTAPTVVSGLKYTGSNQALIKAGSDNLEYVFADENGAPISSTWTTAEKMVKKDAGNYIILYRVKNNEGTAPKAVNVSIAKADPIAVDGPKAIKGLKYTGGDQELVEGVQATARPQGVTGMVEDVEVEYRIGTSGDWTSAIPMGREVNTYEVYYRVAASTNYNAGVETLISGVEIHRATPTIGEAQIKSNFNFTGSAQQVIIKQPIGSYDSLVYAICDQGKGEKPESLPEDRWVTYDQITVTAVGTYKVYAKSNQTTHYEASNIIDLGTVTVATGNPDFDNITVPKRIDGLVYNGSEQELVTRGQDDIVYQLDRTDGEWSSEVPKAKAGKHTVYYKLNGDQWKEKIEQVVVEIAEGEVTLEATKSSLTYNGGNQALLTGVTVKDSVTDKPVQGLKVQYYLGKNKPTEAQWVDSIPMATDAGEYTVWYRSVDGTETNYKASQPASVTVTIAKKQVVVVAPEANPWEFDGHEHALVKEGSVEGGHLVYILNGSETTESPKMVDAKTYDVYYRVVCDDNYMNAEDQLYGPISVTVTPAKVDMNGIGWVDKDGNAVSATGYEYARQNGEAVKYGVKLDLPENLKYLETEGYITYTGEYESSAVGTHTASFDIVNNNGNILIVNANKVKDCIWKITQKKVSAPVFVGEHSYEYDYEGHTILDMYYSEEADWSEYVQFIVTKDKVRIDTDKIKDAGTYVIQIASADSANVQLVNQKDPVTIVINKKVVTVGWAQGKPPVPTGLDDIAGEYELTYYLNGQPITGDIHDPIYWDKELVVKVSIKDEYKANIELKGEKSIKFKMYAGEAVVVAVPTLKTNTLVYNGNKQSFAFDGFDAKYVEYIGEHEFTNAGKYTITIRLKSNVNAEWADGDQSLSKTYEVEITKAEISVSWDQSSGKPVLFFNDKNNIGKGKYDYIYRDENGNQVQPSDLVDGDVYTVEAVLKPEFAGNYVFVETDKNGDVVYSGPATNDYSFTCGEVIIDQAQEELPIWQLTVGSILIILFLIFMFKSISLSHKVKEEEDAAEEDRTMYSSFIPLGILASLGLLNSHWTIIVIAIAGLTLIMMFVMIWKSFKLKRVKKARKKQAEKMQEQAMKMMFGAMNGVSPSLQGGAPLSIGYGNDNMSQSQPLALGYNNNDFAQPYGGYNDYNAQGYNAQSYQNPQNYNGYGNGYPSYDQGYDDTYARYAEEEERMRRMVEEQAQALEEMKRKAEEFSSVEATFTPEEDYTAPAYTEYEPEPVITPEPIVTPSPQSAPVMADGESAEDDVWSSEEEEQEWTMDVDMDITNDDGKYVTKVEKQRVPANFRMRLKMSVVENRHFYEAIKNRLCRGSGVAHRVSGKVEKFRYHEDIISVIGIGRQGLKLWLALDPNQFDSAKYGWQDMSSNPSFAKIPMYIEIHNDVELANALELIDILYDKYAVAPRKKYTDKSNQELIFTLHGNKLAKDSVKKLLLRESVSVGEIDILTNEEAEACEEMVEIPRLAKENFASVSISMLEKHYCDGQTVNLESLKKKGLVDADCNGYTVTMGDALSKPLVVEANEFSVGSVKMIILTGGRAVRLVSKD